MLDAGTMSLGDFSTKTSYLAKYDPAIPENYIVQEDTYNYRNDSLFKAYTALWEALNEFDLGITTETTKIDNCFMKLVTFPFDKVTSIHTDYVRKLTKRYLSLSFLPYTETTSNALTFSLKHYPDTSEERDLVKNVKRYIASLKEAIENQQNQLVSTTALTQYINDLTALIYKVPEKLYWTFAEEYFILANHFKLVYGQNTKMDTATQFLTEKTYTERQGYKDFEERLVSDVTILLSFDYPHPQIYIALKKLNTVLDLYYTETQRSKLFIDNVAWKMQKYFQKCLAIWTEEEIEKITGFASTDTISKPNYTLEERYNIWLQAIRHHQLDGSHLQDVLEGATYFKRKSYEEVVHLPNFTEMIWYVNSLTQTTL